MSELHEHDEPRAVGEVDLDALDALDALAARANAEHHAYETTQTAALAHAIAAGDALNAAKERVGHGGWLAWVDEHCDFTDRTAARYMRIARNKTRVSDLDSVRAALDVLTAPRLVDVPGAGEVVLQSAGTYVRRVGIGSSKFADPRPIREPEEPPLPGLFRWMVPWEAECPNCGRVVYPRPLLKSEPAGDPGDGNGG